MVPSFFCTLIDVIAGASDVITLEGPLFDGACVRFRAGGHLHVFRCVIINGSVAGDAGIAASTEQREQTERDRHGD